VKKRSFLAPLLKGASPVPKRLLNATRSSVLATVVEAAFTSSERRTGLLSRNTFEAGHALIIAPSNAIHTFFMKFPIDVIYFARDGKVLKSRENLRPWRVSGALRGYGVVELPAGTLARTPVSRGDMLTIE
jgi:hypothetical protein